MAGLALEPGTWLYRRSPQMKSIDPIIPEIPNKRKDQVVKMNIAILLMNAARWVFSSIYLLLGISEGYYAV